MTCGFSMDHYREILTSALESDYKFVGFTQTDLSGDRVIYLRHDVDLSFLCAVEMAEVEASLGIRSTYLFLNNSPFYSLHEDRVIEGIYEIKEMGHWIGLHIDLPESRRFEQLSIPDTIDVLYESFRPILHLDKVVSFHIPSDEVLNRTFAPYINTYGTEFFSKIKYLADSQRRWREKCPCEDLKRGSYQEVQLLIHPFWWIGGEDYLRFGKEMLEERIKELKNDLIKNAPLFKDLLE